MTQDLLNKGLQSDEVLILRKQFGYNDLYIDKPNIFWTFFKQFLNPIVILMIISVIVTFYLGDKITGFVLLSFLTINTILGFYHELKNSLLINSLSKFITYSSQVIRDGQIVTIPSRELVPQDIIYLKNGDVVPADVTAIFAMGLEIDESTLTGETLPDNKASNENIYSGTYVVSGSGYAQVDKTGKDTEFNKISHLALNSPKPSQFNVDMTKISKTFILVGFVFLTLTFVLNYFKAERISTNELLVFTLALALSLIPEGLPLITTIALANGASKIAKKGSIIRSISALEDMGNVDVLCTDKTGTLTKNNNQISSVIIDNQKLYSYLLKIPTSDSTSTIDKLLIDYAQKFSSVRAILNTGDFVEYIPFDSKTRLSGHKFVNGTIWFGSPKEVLSKLIMDELFKLETLSKIEQEEQKGLRSIGIGWSDSYDYSRMYLGTFLLKDEIKPDSATIVNDLFKLGIRTKLISGDSLLVCTNVGLETKIALSADLCINANELNYDNLEVLLEQVKHYNVFARANPEQKNAIINALTKSHTVAYIGDGINDAPALRAANVGIAVDNGTDIAKSVADIVLTQPDLSIVKDAIIEGRTVFENINKFLKHSLAGNFGNFFTIGIASLFLPFVPILAVQIIIASLLIDFVAIQLAFDNVDHDDISKPKHMRIFRLLTYALALGIMSSIIDLLFLYLFQKQGAGNLQTGWFLLTVLTEVLLFYCIRIRRPITYTKTLKPSFVITTIVVILISIILSLIGFKYINVAVIDIKQVGIIILIALTYLLGAELIKKTIYSVRR